MVRYFEWMGAARYTADQRSGSMHGKQFLMDEVFAGIDEEYVYGRLDFAGKVPEDAFRSGGESGVVGQPCRQAPARIAVGCGRGRRPHAVVESDAGERQGGGGFDGCDGEGWRGWRSSGILSFACRSTWLLAAPLEIEKVRGPKSSDLLTTRLRLRFSLWQNHLPVDALPVEGWIELELLAEEDLLAVGG